MNNQVQWTRAVADVFGAVGLDLDWAALCLQASGLEPSGACS